MQKCILKWLVSVSESVSERIRTFQLPCLETYKPGGATVHHNVNKYSEVNTNGGRLADWHVRSLLKCY